MFHCLKLIQIATFSAIVSWMVFGQQASARTCRILFPDRPGDAPRSLHLFDGISSQEVELPSMNLSTVYELPAGPLNLRLLPDKVDDPSTISPDSPSVEVPETYTDFYLIVFGNPKNKISPVKLEVINADSENFKPGQTLWLNKTGKTIKGKWGEQTLKLEPESSEIVNSPLDNQNATTSAYFSASFTYRIQGEAVFAPITEQQWWFDANCRHLGFVMDSGGKLPQIYFFRDFRVTDQETQEVPE